jgi:PAS domain S-box-containing protein
MEPKLLRYFILSFSVLSSVMAYYIRMAYPVLPVNEPWYFTYVVSAFCFALFVLSFINPFRSKLQIILYTFKITVSSWFIVITAVNNFAPDYAYTLFFVLFVIGLVFSNSKHFALFYAYSFVLLLVLSMFFPSSEIIKPIYLITIFLAGIMIYFRLRTREQVQEKLEKYRMDSVAILENSLGIFFYIDTDYKIICFNKLAFEQYKIYLNKEIKSGDMIFDLLSFKDHLFFHKSIDAALKGEVIREEYEIEFDNGLNYWAEIVLLPVFSETKQIKGVSITVVDIGQRKKAELEIRKQNLFLETLLNTINSPIFYKDRNGVYIGCNKAFEEFFGFSKDQIIGKTAKDISPPELAEMYHQSDIDLIETGGSHNYESYVKSLNGGEVRNVVIYKSALLNEEGTPNGVVGFMLDITEQKKMQDALRLSEERFRDMADTLPSLIYESDTNGNITYFNKVAFEYTGYDLKDYEKGIPLLQMFPENEKLRAIENAREALKGEPVGVEEFNLLRKDGAILPVLINTVPVVIDNKVVGRRGVVTDISSIKFAEEKIKSSLKEKEILLREIHHRVKNNLQVIISMLRLQTKNIADAKTIEVFREAQNRVNSMSLVHDKLYKADDFSRIDLVEYVNDLVASIKKSYFVNNNEISIRCNVDNFTLNIDSSIPLGLMINELLTNCLKYAFPSKKGEIVITIKKTNTNKILLSVKDNGVGIKENVDFENASSLGLRLVNMLVTQLNGDLRVTSDNGTEFIVIFQEYFGRE